MATAEMEWDKFAMVLYLMSYAPLDEMKAGHPLDPKLWSDIVGSLDAQQQQVFRNLTRDVGGLPEEFQKTRDLLHRCGRSSAWTTEHFVSKDQLRQLWNMGTDQARAITAAAREAERRLLETDRYKDR